MENKNQYYQFKTNIKCSGCVAAVKPHLDNTAGISHWEVDTAGNDKLLSVHATGTSRDQVMEAVQQAGFNIEPVNT